MNTRTFLVKLVCVATATTASAQVLETQILAMIQEEFSSFSGYSVKFLEHRTTGPFDPTYAVKIQSTEKGAIALLVKVRESTEEANQNFEADAIKLLKLLDRSIPESEVRIGERSVSPVDSKFPVFLVLQGKRSYSFTQLYSRVREDGSYVLNGQTLEADKAIIEGLSRRVVGRWAALESTPAPNVQIGSATVLARRGDKGQLQLNLNDWCAAKGITLNSNPTNPVATFQSGGNSVILPLASNQIKIGSDWVKADEVSLLHNDMWYVPKTLLDAAVN